MSLLNEAFTPCKIMTKTVIADGMGGTITTYVEGTTIQVAISFDNSVEAQIASASGVNSRYTLTTRRNTKLDYHDIIKRISDSKIFRITSDGDDVFTPSSAGLDMRQVQAEEWQIP